MKMIIENGEMRIRSNSFENGICNNEPLEL